MTALSAALAARRLAEEDSAWSLLRATNGPVVVAVLGAHLAGETRRMPAPVLFELIEADLEDLRGHGFDLPQTAVQYCRGWLDAGYLVRRPTDAREEVYELSEGALVAIRFVEQLIAPRPSATESRLATIVERIHQLAIDTDPDVTRRIAALQAERDRLDARIAALTQGDVDVLAEDRALERAVDILSLTAELPEDFARVRAAMEQLNRELRSQLVEEPESRGTVLDDIFRGVDLMAETDAGRSFAAFYALILDAERTTALEEELETLVRRPFAQSLSRDQARQLARLLPAMQEAGTEIHEVMTSFSRSLRRFVTSEELAEDRRVHRLVRETLAEAAALAEEMPPYRQLGIDLRLTAVSPSQISAMRLLNPADSETTTSVETATPEPADLAALREFVRASEIDMGELRSSVNGVLAAHGPATVAEILAARPATQGAASVVGLMVLAEEHAIRIPEATERVAWTPVGDAVQSRTATLPSYLFEDAIP